MANSDASRRAWGTSGAHPTPRSDGHAAFRVTAPIGFTRPPRSFVPYYAQRISSAIVMNGAQGMLDAVSRARRSDQLRRPARA